MSIRPDSLAEHGAEGRNGGDVRLGELQDEYPLLAADLRDKLVEMP